MTEPYDTGGEDVMKKPYDNGPTSDQILDWLNGEADTKVYVHTAGEESVYAWFGEMESGDTWSVGHFADALSDVAAELFGLYLHEFPDRRIAAAQAGLLPPNDHETHLVASRPYEQENKAITLDDLQKAKEKILAETKFTNLKLKVNHWVNLQEKFNQLYGVMLQNHLVFGDAKILVKQDPKMPTSGFAIQYLKPDHVFYSPMTDDEASLVVPRDAFVNAPGPLDNGIASIHPVRFGLVESAGGSLEKRKGYERFIVCTGHVPVDNGMGKSWCKTCDRDLEFRNLQWVEKK